MYIFDYYYFKFLYEGYSLEALFYTRVQVIKGIFYGVAERNDPGNFMIIGICILLILSKFKYLLQYFTYLVIIIKQMQIYKFFIEYSCFK